MEEHARRRLQQQFEQQLELIRLKMMRQRQLLAEERYRQRQQEVQVMAESEDDYNNNNGNGNNDNDNQQYDQYDNAEADAAYGSPMESMPDVRPPLPPLLLPPPPNFNELSGFNRNQVLRERIPFAVGPNDARFFDNANDPSGELDSQALEDYEEYAPAAESAPEVVTFKNKPSPVNAATVSPPKPVEPPKLLDTSTANFHRIKPQSAAAAAVAGVNLPQQPSQRESHNEITALINKLQKQNQSPHLGLASSAVDADQIVLRQHLGMNSEMGVYIVALIAGVSAAVTVGLLALGVTW